MTVRLGIVGCGAAAQRIHLPALKAMEDVDVVAFASRSVSSAERAAQGWGRGRISDDWRALVVSDEVDAVLVSSPNAFHAEQVVMAAAAGKHVLVEKPMATTTADADRMIAAAEAADIVLHVAHNLRAAAPFVAARTAFAGGRVGPLTGFRAAFGHGGPQTWAPEATWFFDAGVAGGGALLDLGIHMIDMIRFVTGDEVVEVAAMTADDPVERTAQLVLRTRSGAVGSLHASWSAVPAPDHQLTIFGRDGTLHLDARTPLTLRTSDGDERVDLPTTTWTTIGDFVRVVDGGRPVGSPATGHDGRAAVAVAEAAYAAARGRRVVPVA